MGIFGFSLTEAVGVCALCYIIYHLIYRVCYDLYVHCWGATNARERIKRLGNWAVITGATSGVGLQWSHLMASWGFDLILHGIPEKSLYDLATEISNQYGVKVEPVFIDFTTNDPNDYEPLRQTITGKDVAILFNNAGVIYDAPDYFDRISPKMLTSIVDVNCKALTLVAHTVLQECMLKQQKGIIMNMSSNSCIYGCPLLSAYAASKGYVRDLTEQLAVEYSHITDLHFQYFAPMFICTNMTKYSDRINRPSLTVPSAEQFVNYAKLTLGMGLSSTGFPPHTLMSWIENLFPRRLNIWVKYRFMDHFRRNAIKTQ